MAAKSKKLLSGNGWSFEPGVARERKEIVSLPPERQNVRIALEKRAKGKEVTRISGLALSDADRKALAASLKKACGSGGSDSGDAVEIQGDHRQAVAKHLANRGWNIR